MRNFQPTERFSTLQLIAFVIWLCSALTFACRDSQTPQVPNSNSSETSGAISLVPPFSTKEPLRYQAVRILTFTSASYGERTTSTILARDGEKRREEFKNGEGGSVVYLDIPSGEFVLLPSSRLFADLNQAVNEGSKKSIEGDLADLSPDLLVNQGYSGSTYEKIGTEIIDGRPTVKYRVTATSPGQPAMKSETLIWIDEEVGMPVKSETTLSGEHPTTTRMEMRDIKLSVDEHLFAVPVDYQKVDLPVIMERIRGRKQAP